MNWLSAHINTLLDLEQEKEDAAALESLRAVLAAKPLPDGTDNAITLLEKLRRGQAVPGLETIQDELLKQLRKWYAKAVESNPNIDKLRQLLLPLADSCSRQPTDLVALSWPLDADVNIAAPPDIQLKTGLQTETAARIVLCPTLPENAGQMAAGQSLLQASVAGELDVNTGIDLPVSRFRLSANAAASGSFACSYYSLHASNTRFAPALAACFGRLETAPFDLDGVAKRFRFRELQCIALNAKGSISFGGQIALASPVGLGVNADLADLAYGYTAALEGEFDYLLHSDDTSPDKVLLRLSRRREVSGTQRLGAQVGLDLTSTYLRIREEIQGFLGKAAKVLEGAETWLAPGELIREKVRKRLGKLDDGSEKQLAPVLAALFGFEPGATAMDTLCQGLAEGICTSLADLEGDAATASALQLDRLLSRLNLPPAQRQDLLDKLKDKLEKALSDLQTQAAADLGKLAAKKAPAQITEAFNEAGETLTQPLDTLDAKLDALRRLVKRYRELAAKLYAAVQGTTQLKIAASLEARSTQTDTRSADLALRFDPASEAAARAFRLTMLGHFEQALDLARTGGQGVELLECALSRVLQNTGSIGLEVSVLGFALKSSSVLSRETRIDSDIGGNLFVQSKAAVEERRQLMDESKAVRFVDVFVLAAAKRTRTLTLGVTLSYEDKKLELREAEGFFASLAGAGLLTQASVDKAMRYLREVEAKTPVCNQEGRLDVSLALDGPALECLLGVGDVSDQKDRVMRIAAQEMASAYLAMQGGRTREADIIRWLEANFHVEPKLVDNVRLGIGPAIGGMTDDPIAYTHANAINHLHALGEELAEALAATRDLYQTPPEQLATWDAQTWQDRQDAILLKVRGNVPGDFPTLFGKEKVRPRTLALFRILARLSGRLPAQDGGDVLTGSMSLCGGKARQLARLA